MRIALALVLACFSAQASDEIFRCEGPEGVTTYSSKPCGPDAQPVTLRPEPPPTAFEDTTVADFKARQAAEQAQAGADLRAREAAHAASEGCNAEIVALQRQMEEVRSSNAVEGNVSYTYASMWLAAEAEQRKKDQIEALEAQASGLRASCDAIWQSTYEANLQAK